MTDDATRAALAALETAAIERLAAELTRAEDLARAHAEALRGLHTDHDSDVAALARARAAHASREADARTLGSSAREVEDLREAVSARQTRIRRASRALRAAEADLARLRHDMAQRIARRAALSAQTRVTIDDDEP